MERKNITIREDQSEWIDAQNVNLSRLVRETIDDAMAPGDEELAEAYRENADHAAEVNQLWSNVSNEANRHLGEHPGEE